MEACERVFARAVVVVVSKTEEGGVGVADGGEGARGRYWGTRATESLEIEVEMSARASS